MVQISRIFLFTIVVLYINYGVYGETPLDNCTLAKSGIDPTSTGAAQWASVNWVNEPNQCYILCAMNYGLFGTMGQTPCQAYAFSYSVPLYSASGDLCYIYTAIPDASSISATGTYDLYTCPPGVTMSKK